jgi:hypothetical protein
MTVHRGWLKDVPRHTPVKGAAGVGSLGAGDPRRYCTLSSREHNPAAFRGFYRRGRITRESYRRPAMRSDNDE